MLKKLSNYVSLIAILGSFFLGPIHAIAETTMSDAANDIAVKQTTESTDAQETTNNSGIIEQSTDATSSAVESAQEQAEATTVATTEQTEITEIQPRAPSARANAVLAATQDYGTNYLVSGNLYKNSDGKDIKVEDVGNGNPFAGWIFKIPGGENIQAGDTMTFPIPESIRISTTRSVEIKDEVTGGVIGTALFTANGHTVTVTLSQYAQDHNSSEINGFFGAWVTYTGDKVVQGQETEFDWGVNKSYVYIIPNVPNPRMLTKAGWIKSDDPTKIQWTVTLNDMHETIHHALVTDYIGPSQTVVPGSFRMHYFAPDGSQVKVIRGAEADAMVTITEQGFTVDFGTLQNRIIMYYDTQTTNNGDDVSYSNTARFTGDSIETKEVNANTPNTGVAGAGYALSDLSVKKVWNDNDNQDGLRPNKAEIQLMRDNVAYGEPIILNDANNWTHNFTNLPQGSSYRVEEINVPAGYTAGYSTQVTDGKGVTTVTNIHRAETIELKGIKTWEDGEDQDGIRPDMITVNLYADGEKIESKNVYAETDWVYSFVNLPKNKGGKEIVYEIKEEKVAGYTTKVDGSNLTNTHVPEVTKVSGTKTWNDANNQDGKRPESITVNLFANGEKKDSTEVKEVDGWTYEFVNLPKYQNGKEINYTVSEETVDGYSTSYNGNNIINSYTPGKTSISVIKNWDDADNQDGIRPLEVFVQLYADGVPKGSQVSLNAGNNWQTSWTELALKSAGKDIVYTVEEIGTAAGYDSAIDTTDPANVILTNTHTPELTVVKGTKTWNDKNNQDGKRPESITINLLANGVPQDSVIVTEATDWTYEFADLPKYQNGEIITYTITEDSVDSYSPAYDGTDVTNSYTPEATSVTVTKSWNDGNNQDGLRPEEILIQLYANGEKKGEPISVTEDMNWTYTWSGLDKFADGKEINYTMEEVAIPTGYTSAIDDSDKGNVVLTNTHTPEVLNVAGAKTWNDKNNQDGKRPSSITINLLANGEVVDNQEVTEETDWTYEFIGLPKYQNGEIITYTITENAVSDYSAEYDGYNVTNTHTPGVTTATVTKAWNDDLDVDKLRPESIQVQLYADGEVLGEPVTLTAKDNWTYTWTELDEKAKGQIIEYTVKELTEVPEYTTTVNDSDKGNMIITNTHTPNVPPIITKDVEGKQRLDLKDIKQAFDWHITSAFGNTTTRWNRARIIDEVDPILTIQRVKVTDQAGNDVTKNGTLSIKDNKVVFDLDKKNGSFAYLAHQTYVMTITTTINETATDADLTEYAKAGGIVNQADLLFGNQVDQLTSGTPVVVPPTKKPIKVPNKPTNQAKIGMLPKTGASNSSTIFYVGIGILFLLGVIYWFKRKKVSD